jgi:DNA polymerase epsilon subunit 1
MREFDIPYHSRVCIDCNIRAGKWFQMDVKAGIIEKMTVRDDILSRPELKVLAFDIETSKDPLKFPDSQKDVVMMISLMFDGLAYLIVNLGFCGQPVTSFSYTPKA